MRYGVPINLRRLPMTKTTQPHEWQGISAYNAKSDLLKPFVEAVGIRPTDEAIQAMAAKFSVDVSEIEATLGGIADLPLYRNDTYQVSVRDQGDGMIHLSIKRLDKAAVHDWRHMQEIKNMLVGPEYEALEIYPAQERLVDTANQYHLWVFTDPDFRVPFGFPEGMISYDHKPETNTQQRER